MAQPHGPAWLCWPDLGETVGKVDYIYCDGPVMNEILLRRLGCTGEGCTKCRFWVGASRCAGHVCAQKLYKYDIYVSICISSDMYENMNMNNDEYNVVLTAFLNNIHVMNDVYVCLCVCPCLKDERVKG